MSKKIALIGSGNAFFKDEGIGLYAAKYLKENYEFEPNIDIVDGGTLGFRLMPLLQEYDEVIIVNTASEDDLSVGEISVKNCDEFLDGSLVKKTANEVEIAEMLQICSLSEAMAETTLISIVPEDIITVEVGLSDNLIAVWPKFTDVIIQELERVGAKAIKQGSVLSLAEILDQFANPSIEHGRGF